MPEGSRVAVQRSDEISLEWHKERAGAGAGGAVERGYEQIVRGVEVISDFRKSIKIKNEIRSSTRARTTPTGPSTRRRCAEMKRQWQSRGERFHYLQYFR